MRTGWRKRPNNEWGKHRKEEDDLRGLNNQARQASIEDQTKDLGRRYADRVMAKRQLTDADQEVVRELLQHQPRQGQAGDGGSHQHTVDALRHRSDDGNDDGQDEGDEEHDVGKVGMSRHEPGGSGSEHIGTLPKNEGKEP